VTAPVYEIVLAPKEGDGFLTAADVAASVVSLPPGARVLVRFEFCEDYEPAAPGVLARHLAGCVVEHWFANAAWRVAEWWSEAYDREAAAYLTVEAERLLRGA
jgi:hypothetical protein